jgi:dipeptidyl aminopeptidase/acylaminoacyl peptidase
MTRISRVPRVPAGPSLLAFTALLAACATAPQAAVGPQPASHLDRLPPIIDREVFFGDPEIAGAQLSPDGRFISFLRSHAGQMNVWVKRFEEPFDAARPITADSTRPVTSYFWSPDGRWILYAQDKGGDENFRIYRVDPAAAPAPGSTVPPATDLTPYDNVQARIVATRWTIPDRVMVGLNDRDPRLHDIYWVDLASGERNLVYRNEINAAEFTADRAGNLRLASRLDAAGGTEILRIDGDEPRVIYGCSSEEECAVLRFHPDERRVYMKTNRGDADRTRLVLFDPETGSEEVVEEDPEGEVDFATALFGTESGELLATLYVADRLRIYFRNPDLARDYERVRAAVGDGDIYLGSRTRDEMLQLITVTSDVDPGAAYLLDRRTGDVTFLFRPRPNLPRERLARMQPVRYPARDGMEIPAYLTVPQGVEPRGLPTIVLPHGGPWARDTWGYDAFAQFLANRGFVVLQPNFRGSTGFGKAFLNAGHREWGTGAMQHDVTDGALWLIQQGIADPDRVGIMGGSYGGFATLAGLAFTPDVYAAGVSIVGPSSIITLIESIPPYWEPLVRIFSVRVGDLDVPADRERLRAQSPLYAAENIRAPLLVIQGANDPRVKKPESDQIVIALRDLGRDVEYLVAPDEGHGFANRVNRIAMFAAIERFLAPRLGGRYQEDMPDEIAERLASHLVDVDTLRLVPATAVSAEDFAPPVFDGAAVRPGTLRYSTQMQVMGQSLELAGERTVEAATVDGRQVWRIIESARTPMGAIADSTLVDAATLAPIRRVQRQGAAVAEMSFAGDSVTGRIQAGPQELPIRAGAAGGMLADGAPLHVALATLPLAAGYATAVRLFELMGGAPRLHRVEVTGTETVIVPAGEFETYRVEIQPADGGSATVIWYERAAPHRLIRAEATLPAQAGGGQATTELVEG